MLFYGFFIVGREIVRDDQIGNTITAKAFSGGLVEIAIAQNNRN